MSHRFVGLCIDNQMNRRGVVDNPLALYPGIPNSMPSSPNLSAETLSHDPIFWDFLHTEPVPVEPWH